MSDTEARKKAPANYALEMFVQKNEQGKVVWTEIEDGFVSPEQAVEYAKKEKVVGVIRVVRIASPLMGGDVVVAEPIYVLKKLGEEKKTKVRKPREKKEVKVSEEKQVKPTEEVKKPIEIEEAVAPVVSGGDNTVGVVMGINPADEIHEVDPEDIPLPEPDEGAGELDADAIP